MALSILSFLKSNTVRSQSFKNRENTFLVSISSTIVGCACT